MQDAESQSLISVRSLDPIPGTLTKLIKRIRALTLKLLPVQVEPEAIAAPTSRVITPQVIHAYAKAAGDFSEALPYCLLQARKTFMWDASHNAADYDENIGRAIACEVLARRIVHSAPPDRLHAIMSRRFRHEEWDGDNSSLSSALEMAIDQHCTIFLSSSEAQEVINNLWRGDWVQRNNANNDIDYLPYEPSEHASIWGHLDPARLSVPRYQNFMRVIIWLLFLFVYSQAVRQPLTKINPDHQFDKWEGLLYSTALAYSFEELHKLYKTMRYFTYRAIGFWTVIQLTIDGLLVSAFILRILGLSYTGEQGDFYRTLSFQVLSCVGPFIWMKLVTVVDGFKYVGTMQILVTRMLQESTIFFALLGLLMAGFAQGMYALDAADGQTDETNNASVILNTLLQALLQAPDFQKPAQNAFALTLYYLWNIAASVILLNVLVALFASAYSEVVDDASAQFLTFFAGKTISMIRAPDTFVYPPPFNLIEILLIAPFEPFLSAKAYAKLNRIIMTTIFVIPLTLIALFEATLDTKKNLFMRQWFEANDDDDDDPLCRDPVAHDDEAGDISKVPFSELVKAFPDLRQSVESSIIHEIHKLQAKVERLEKTLEEKSQG